MRKKYRIVSAEGYPLYDSTLREAFNAPYILASLERALSETEGQDKDIKSAFARNAKSDLIAYESLKAKREAELEELYKRPFEDIAVEEFLDQLPKPQIEEVEEPVPMDTAEAPQENATSSAVDAEAGDLPQGKMPDSAEATTPDVPMETEAPESSPQGEASGVKVEPAESSPPGEASATVDDPMGVAEEVKEEEVDLTTHDEEVMPPDLSPEKDTGLYDQGIWGQVETPFDPKAFRESAQKAAASAEAENEKAFANMEEASDKKELVDTEEYKYFRDYVYVFYQEERGSPLRVLVDQRNGYSYSGFYHTGICDDPIPSFKCQHMIFRVQALILSRNIFSKRSICTSTCAR